MARHVRSARLAQLLGILVTVGACDVGCGGASGSAIVLPGSDAISGDASSDGDNTLPDGDVGDTTASDGATDGSTDETTTSSDAGDASGDVAIVDVGTDTTTADTADDSASSDAADATSAEASTDDSALEAAPEVGAETGAETGVETGPEASVETGPVVAACGTANTIAGCGYDSDGDGISDSIEGRGAGPGGTDVDTDGDGTPDYLDCDSDNDTVPDAVEWITQGCDATGLNDADGDGVPNFRDTDSDGNGLGDKDEVCPPAAALTKLGMAACTTASGGVYPYDFDGDGYPDFIDPDNDHDSISTTLTVGLEDSYELTDFSGTYVGAIDTDGDGIPDVWDRDSDNDFIVDQSDGLGDFDKDGVQNFRDTDSDGDGVPDRFEGHTTLANASPRSAAVPASVDDSVALLSQAPVDNDGDGAPDFLDLDSDNDFLPDGQEDKNADGYVESTETDRINADTDGDGVPDFVEVTIQNYASAAGNWANNPAITPQNQGYFYFVSPYSTDGSSKPSPTDELLALSTSLNEGDVGFVVDTTGSMTGEISNLRTSLSSIITSLQTAIPNLAIGVAAHDDFPYCTNIDTVDFTEPACAIVEYEGGAYVGEPAGNGFATHGDQPFYIASPSNGYVTTTTATSQTAVNSLTIHDGVDLPESQVVAYYKALTGAALSWPKATAATGEYATGDVSPAGSEAADSPPSGTFGALHFRNAALPIIIGITDAPMHNGKRALDKTGATYDTAFQYAYSFSTFNVDQLVTAINAAGAKYIGISADVPTSSNEAVIERSTNVDQPYGYQAYIADKTSSLAPPSAFGAGSTKCLTGPSGAAVAADGPSGECRMVFEISTDGTGLGTSIVTGVKAMLASLKFDVHVQATSATGSSIDVVKSFVQSVNPQAIGGKDPVTGGTCVSFATSSLADNYLGPANLTAGSDGIDDTIKQLTPGSLYCFDVVPIANTTVPATSTVQLFKAELQAYAAQPKATFALGTQRDVLFIVPPLVN